MRNVLLFTITILLYNISLVAQYQKPILSEGINLSIPMSTVDLTGFEAIERVTVPLSNNASVFLRTEQEVTIGETVYDLQTNGAMQNRLVRNEDNGNLAGVWTLGTTATGFSERGTGYNTSTNGAWGAFPDIRLENERTGWPSISILEDGSHVVIAHNNDNLLLVNRQVNGAWLESILPSMAAESNGMLWPHAVAGGEAGNTIHAVALTIPEANGGTAYEGVSGHLLYHRSLDGGATWDAVDVIIPGIDNSRYAAMTGDSYAIDADGDHVAIAVFAGIGDVVVAKSADNGATWTTTVVHDVPFDNYVTDMGYDTALIDPQESATGPLDANGMPTGTAIQTSDGTGDVLIDKTGMVHVFYGEMYLQDIDMADGRITLFPFSNGVRYWNETFGADSTRVIAGLIDGTNGDGIFTFPMTINNAGIYDVSATAHITAGVDKSNNIFIAYAALTEDFINPNANPAPQNNRHILTTASLDGGETWVEPFDLIREEVVIEPDMFPLIEAIYPSMARNVGDSRVHLIYQQDVEPGSAVAGVTNMEGDEFGVNYINYIGVTLDEYGITTATETVAADLFNFALAPNPTSGMVRVSYELPKMAKVTMTITNTVGQVLQVIENRNHAAGTFSTPINIDNLSSGIYLVTFQANERLLVEKLVVK